MESRMPDTAALRDSAADGLTRERGNLINLAYRLLGTFSDAEDAVQEGFARWYALGHDQQQKIRSPGAWLTTVVGRICLDQLKSARVQRQSYVGEWIPEPLPGGSEWLVGQIGGGEPPPDPLDRVTLDESIQMAFMVVLETLTPAERVSFILHDVFQYSFVETADIVGRSPAACRQLATSARRRIASSEFRSGSATASAMTVHDFLRAWEAQDIRSLVGLLDPNVASFADSGGHVPLAFETVRGAQEVATALAKLIRRTPTLNLCECKVNGQPGIEVRQEGLVVSVLAFEVTVNRIVRIWVVRNPEKLGAWRLET